MADMKLDALDLRTASPAVWREVESLRADLARAKILLERWRSLSSEPGPGEGLTSTEEDSLRRDAWQKMEDSLVADTDLMLGGTVDHA
jgi:hypothetical protein